MLDLTLYYRLVVKIPFSKLPKTRRLQRQLVDTEVELDMVKAELRKMKKTDKKADIPGSDVAQPSTPSTPKSQAINLAKELDLTPSVERVNKLVPYTLTVQQVSTAKTSVKQALFASTYPQEQNDEEENTTGKKTTKEPSLKKRKNRARGVAHVLSKKIKLSRDYIFRRKKKFEKRATMAKETRNKIIEFLMRDDNSYTLPGKKDQVRGQQIYALCDTLRNLHNKFILENPQIPVSNATFCRARPRNIRITRLTQRKVCLCYKHTNISLKLQAVKTLPKSTSALLELRDDEIKMKLEAVEHDEIRYFSWGKEEICYKDGKKTTKLRLHEKKTGKKEFMKELLEELPDFRDHCHRVGVQFTQVRLLKNRLEPEIEATCQLDYAENWKAKYMEEVTSAYYDKNQITVHPMVVHTKDVQGKVNVKSYVGVTDVTNHSVSTTFAFIKALIPQIKEDYPRLQALHFISDSPSSQYRNKYVCNIIARFPALFSLQGSWSWLESGHGKGPCDGVGGSVKSKADNLVKTKLLITNADEFCNEISKQETKMTLIKIDEDDVEKSKEEISKWTTPAVKGVSNMHTVVPIAGELFMRPTSCFDVCCFQPPSKFTNACPSWERTGLKIVMNAQEQEEETVQNTEEEDEGMMTDHSALDSDDEPIINIIKKRKIAAQKKEDENPQSDVQVGNFIATGFGGRWYVAKILEIDNDEVELDYMSPWRGKWKWGQSDRGAILKGEIIHHITSLTKVGNFLAVSSEEKKVIDAKFKQIK